MDPKIQGEEEKAQNNSKSNVILLPQYSQCMKMLVMKIGSLADSKLFCCEVKIWNLSKRPLWEVLFSIFGIDCDDNFELQYFFLVPEYVAVCGHRCDDDAPRSHIG